MTYRVKGFTENNINNLDDTVNEFIEQIESAGATIEDVKIVSATGDRNRIEYSALISYTRD